MKKIAMLLFVSALACWTAPVRPKLSNDLAGVDSQASVRVIIQWTGPADDLKDRKVIVRGGAVLYRLKTIPAGVYTLPGWAVRDLANDPDVSYISPDRPVSPKLDVTAAAVNASTLWNSGWNGAGIAVAVIDSGMNPDLNLGTGTKVVFAYDFTNASNAKTAANFFADSIALHTQAVNAMSNQGGPAADLYGHGQHIAGIIASNGQSSECPNCSRSFKGLAPGVNLIDLKVLDQNGRGSDSAVILAIDAAIALKNVYNVRIINLSLGRPVYESYTLDPLCRAVEAAWRAGIAVVVAAGNEGRDNTYGEQGYGTICAPGNDPWVITVGAIKTEGTPTRADDLVATYSSKGPTQIDHIVKPDILAPGNLIVSLLAQKSTLSTEYPANAVALSYYEMNLPAAQIKKTSNSYFVLSGTSMAAAVVSGAVADLLEMNPSLTPDQVKALLMQTASKNFPLSSTATDSITGQTFTDYYDIFTVGAGYIDLAAAAAAINDVPAGANAISPMANYQSNSGAVTLSFDPASIWSTQSVRAMHGVWGYQSVWGASVLQGNQALWSSNSVWGASSVSSANCVWGAQSEWGTSTNHAESAPITITGEQ